MQKRPLSRIELVRDEEPKVTGRDLVPLEQQTGTIQNIATAVDQSIHAGRSRRRTNRARIAAAERTEIMAVTLIEERLRRALVADAMSEIGALTVDLQARTTAVQQSLTNSSAAEVGSHFMNRNDNVALADDLHARGVITAEEHALYLEMIGEDLVYDISDTRARVLKGKKAAGRLHEGALRGIGGTLGRS
jgi:hypothetical protein